MSTLAWSKLVLLLAAVLLWLGVTALGREGRCKHVSMPTDPRVNENTLITRPVVFIIGAQKGGTTYLYHLLQRHPNIYPLAFTPAPGHVDLNLDMAMKEPHVFDSIRGIEVSKLAQYAAETRPGWVLDATPDYMDTPVAACRIHRYFTNAKFLVVLRDPVARAVSAWTMVQLNHIFHNKTTHRWLGLHRLVDEVHREVDYLTHTLNCSTSSGKPGQTNWGDCMGNHVPFLGCLAKYKSANNCMFGFVWKGLFARQLEFWLSLFPPENFHVMSFHDIKSDSDKVIDGVFRFLNLSQIQGVHKPHMHAGLKQRQAMHSYVNESKKNRWCEYQELRKCITTLTQFFAHPQHDLAELLRKHGWEHAMRAAQVLEYICPIKKFSDII